jgi:large subunit ribosomal protein L10
MSKRLKALIVKELQDEFRGLDRCVIMGLSGIPAGAADHIRTHLESRNIRLRVVKNTLAGVALKELGLAGMEEYLKGPSALVTGGSDIVDLAKTAAELAKSRDGVVVKGGFGEGKVLSSQEIAALSKLPAREEMLATLAGAMSATMGNFAGVLGAVQRKFLYALKALEGQKAGAAAA